MVLNGPSDGFAEKVSLHRRPPSLPARAPLPRSMTGGPGRLGSTSFLPQQVLHFPDPGPRNSIRCNELFLQCCLVSARRTSKPRRGRPDPAVSKPRDEQESIVRGSRLVKAWGFSSPVASALYPGPRGDGRKRGAWNRIRITASKHGAAGSGRVQARHEVRRGEFYSNACDASCTGSLALCHLPLIRMLVLFQHTKDTHGISYLTTLVLFPDPNPRSLPHFSHAPQFTRIPN